MKRNSTLFKAIALVLAVLTAYLSMGITVAADTPASFTVFDGQRKLASDSWYPSFITQYMESAKMDSFIQAIQHDGATIEVTYTGNAKVGLLLQSYPVKSGSQTYPSATISNPTVTTSGNRKVATFKASDLIKAYTSTKHPDDGSYLSLNNVLNFGVDGAGNTVYSVVVRWTYPGDPSINIDTSSTHQTMEGWGASYTWYGDWVSNNNKKEQIFDWIFNDCEFNILRFRDLNRVRGYGGGFEDTNYRTRAYKEYYDAAVKRGITPTVLVTSWGEYRDEDWVALSGDNQGHVYYTLAKDANGNYRYNDLAQFCVKSVQLFIDAGIPVDYFSISNEVELQERREDENGNPRENAGFFLGTTETQNYCSYAKAYIAVYDAFQAAFGEKAPKLLAAETMAALPDLLKAYIDPIIKERPETVTTVAHHLYGSPNTAADFSRISDMYSDKYSIWQTEWYNNDFFGQASTIINELVNENLNAYLYWNGLWIPDNANCLIQIDDWVPNAAVSRRGNHYIMMHFSKFIKAGYVRIDSESYASNVKTVAFKSPDSSKIVLVALNDSANSETIKLNLGVDVKSAEVWRTTKKTDDISKETTLNEYMTKVTNQTVSDGGNLTFPANTLTTVVIDVQFETIPPFEVTTPAPAVDDNSVVTPGPMPSDGGFDINVPTQASVNIDDDYFAE